MIPATGGYRYGDCDPESQSGNLLGRHDEDTSGARNSSTFNIERTAGKGVDGEKKGDVRIVVTTNKMGDSKLKETPASNGARPSTFCSAA